MKEFAAHCIRRIRSLKSDDDGFVVMLTLALFLMLFVLCASVYAVGETIHQKIRLQNACDAAAYSAAVVQADGLSRMATVNQALEWSYVQMTNHEMDYITYRWLALTIKRFDEDKVNAEGYHSYLVVNFNIDQGIWGLIAAAGDLAVNRIVGFYKSSWQLRCNRGHANEGPGWWIGQGPSANARDKIKLNGHPFGETLNRNEIANFLNQMNGGLSTPWSPPVDEPDEDDDDEDDDEVNEDLRDILNPGSGSNGNDGNHDPYGIDAYVDPDDSDYGTGDSISGLDRWRSDSRQKISASVDKEYQDRIEQETDPAVIADLEKERDRKKDGLYSDLDGVYEKYRGTYAGVDRNQDNTVDPGIQAIRDKYDAKKAESPRPGNTSAPDYQDQLGQWYRQQEELEAACQQEIDEYCAANGIRNDNGSGAASNGGSSQSPGVSLVSGGTWESNMRETILGDKATIQLLNDALPAINLSMQTSMRTVAEFVLTNMLRDPRLPEDKAFKKYQVYISIPQGLDPYSAEVDDDINEQALLDSDAGGVASNFFSPLYNTEACERLFLQFGSGKGDGNKKLYEFFPVADASTDAGVGWGLDQWFVRSGKTDGDDGIRHRTEGELGIQRGYKDSNLNETNEGIRIMNKRVDRGNHIANLFLGGSGIIKLESDNTDQSYSQDSSGSDNDSNVFVKFIKNALTSILSSFFEAITDEFCDITASSGNACNDEQFIPMCSKVTENNSLNSEYDWSSAKWLCLAKAKYFALYAEYVVCRKFHKVICDFGAKKRHKRWDVKHRGLGHYHVPKWFCGEKPRFEAEAFMSFSGNPKKNMIVQFGLLDMMPPIYGDIKGSKHGYMDKTYEFSKFKKPFEAFSGSHSSTIRDEYESCVCFIDGMLINKFNFITGGESGLINGHARIYGDDKSVWNPETYVTEKAKPWVLNEKFFSGGGTIVIGAAMKHENPFVQLMTLLQQDDGRISEKSVLSAFDPPSYKGVKYNGSRISAGNYIWTMSAARAGVRRTRRDGDFDQERMYQVVYDPTSDPENLHFASTPYRYMQDSDGNWGWVKYDAGNSAHDPQNVSVLGGCVCSPENQEQFEYAWNLCEQDWDATLLPLRYAGSRATLNLFAPDASHEDRLSAIDSKRNSRSFKDDCGNGRNWTWSPASTGDSTGNANPLNPQNNIGWSPLDPSVDESVKLDSLLPDGEHKLNLQYLLKQNRIL